MIRSILRWFLRLPEHPAKQRIIRKWLPKILPREGVALPVDGGVTLMLHPSDWIEYLLMTTGVYEPVTIRFIRENLPAGANAVLAGVNFGLHLVIAAQCVAETGLVVGVEPQPGSIDRALHNLALNGIGSQVRIASLALHEMNGIVAFDLPPPGNSGAASLLGKEGEALLCGCIRFEDLTEKCKLSAVRIFLLDVEGFEIKVLRGLGTVLPEIIIVEFSEAHQARAGHACGELAALLRELGYSLSDLFGNPLSDAGSNVCESNVVAYRGSLVPKWAIPMGAEEA